MHSVVENALELDFLPALYGEIREVEASRFVSETHIKEMLFEVRGNRDLAKSTHFEKGFSQSSKGLVTMGLEFGVPFESKVGTVQSGDNGLRVPPRWRYVEA